MADSESPGYLTALKFDTSLNQDSHLQEAITEPLRNKFFQLQINSSSLAIYLLK